MSEKKIIQIGLKVNMLTVISELPTRRTKKGKSLRIFLCKCDCGKEKEILVQSILNKKTRSCGCYQKKVVSIGCYAKTHGLSSDPLFTVWKRMLDRCYNPKHKGYKYYGARGIIICDEWKNDVVGFVNWCKINEWKMGLQIDRINVNGIYEPKNCRFVTPYENIMNRRNTIK